MSIAQTALRSFDQLYVGGRWIAPATDATIDVVSPATEEPVATIPDPGVEDAERAVAAARRAFDEGPWPRLSAAERGACVARIAGGLRARSDELATTITAEAGIPIAISPYYVLNAVSTFEDYASMAATVELDELRARPQGRVQIVRHPVGVVLGVCPWNAPMPMAAMKLAPALVAGCTVILKPAQEDPVEAMILAEAIDDAGLPEGVVSVLPASRDVGAHLVRHPGVDKVSFTGSVASGARIMADCAERIARVTLELGGKSAAIVLDDADPADVVSVLVPGHQVACGQICVALSRVLVPETRRPAWVEALASAMAAVPVGDPFDPTVLQGPLISARQRERVEGYVDVGRREGARVVVGGGRPAGLDRGFHFEATLFDEVDNAMRIAQEEIFGPVTCVIGYRDEAEAVRIANDSPLGLAGSVFSADLERARAVARQVRAGALTINAAAPCIAEPFGGFKRSGLGREGGREGLDAFLEIQQIFEPGVL
jgi:betaine-aldehyde dehydrogenase